MKYTKLLVVMVVCVIGLGACDNKSNDDIVVAKQTQAKKQKPAKIPFEQEALAYVQNLEIENYQGATFKQILDKWTNVCKSIEWESSAYEIPKNQSQYNNMEAALVVAWCDVGNIDEIKSKLNSYYDLGYTDWEYNKSRYTFNPFQYMNFIKSHKGEFDNKPQVIIDQIPGGENTIKKLTKGQREKIAKYIDTKYYFPFSQAVNNASNIYLTFPFILTRESTKDSVGAIRGHAPLSSAARDFFAIIANSGIVNINTLRFGFKVDGKKYFTDNPYDWGFWNCDTNGAIKPKFVNTDIFETMYFNKNIGIVDIIDEYYNNKFNGCHYPIKKTDYYGNAYDNPKIHFGSVPKFLTQSNKEWEAMHKDIAEYIIKVYSE